MSRSVVSLGVAGVVAAGLLVGVEGGAVAASGVVSDDAVVVVEPAPVDPLPEDPSPVDPLPEDPSPVDPLPEDPSPVDPLPEDPSPVDPVPVEPPVVDPPVVDPVPGEPGLGPEVPSVDEPDGGSVPEVVEPGVPVVPVVPGEFEVGDAAPGGSSFVVADEAGAWVPVASYRPGAQLARTGSAGQVMGVAAAGLLAAGASTVVLRRRLKA